MAAADPQAHADPVLQVLPGVQLQLLPERALWWPQAGTLFIADLHLGKAATFRARGLPVPAGTTQDNLARLSAVLARTGAGRLVVLGDFLHAAEALTAAVRSALQAWRAAHAGLAVVLVRGNHDRHAGDPPGALALQVVDEPFAPEPGVPLACCHHPQALPGQVVLAGHLHPAVLLRGPGRDALRLPAFCHEAGQVLLPSFGDFTGGHTLRAARGRRLYAVGGGRVWAVPTSSPSPSPAGGRGRG
ncbi:ligase-associated DNA damage response endonuclease PdeM [Melaminivora sp.]|uniref:ligase-associated DNA damage response endonuclease PdeM n=1 Tax=Melaminivora sp. TaxID=1933032 RepID=UPI0028A6F80A|nr:ligase-associated DNA damage response endonuclease PdeM [Melaminivora sp.]